ncbi:MAG: enoyl-CoA hydratase-related protein, partial [Arenimonas sp.]
LSEVKLGLVPAVISPYVIAAIGARQARRYFLTAEIIEAPRAREIGLLHACVPAAQLDETLERILHWLGKAGPQAAREAKRLIAGHAPAQTELQRENQDRDNAALIARLRVGAEGQEGLGAFLDKRAPNWVSGR